MKILHHRRE